MLKHLDYLMISNGGCDPFHYLKGRGGLGYKPYPPFMHGLGYDYNLIDGMGIKGKGWDDDFEDTAMDLITKRDRHKNEKIIALTDLLQNHFNRYDFPEEDNIEEDNDINDLEEVKQDLIDEQNQIIQAQKIHDNLMYHDKTISAYILPHYYNEYKEKVESILDRVNKRIEYLKNPQLNQPVDMKELKEDFEELKDISDKNPKFSIVRPPVNLEKIPKSKDPEESTLEYKTAGYSKRYNALRNAEKKDQLEKQFFKDFFKEKLLQSNANINTDDWTDEELKVYSKMLKEKMKDNKLASLKDITSQQDITDFNKGLITTAQKLISDTGDYMKKDLKELKKEDKALYKEKKELIGNLKDNDLFENVSSGLHDLDVEQIPKTNKPGIQEVKQYHFDESDPTSNHILDVLYMLYPNIYNDIENDKNATYETINTANRAFIMEDGKRKFIWSGDTNFVLDSLTIIRYKDEDGNQKIFKLANEAKHYENYKLSQTALKEYNDFKSHSNTINEKVKDKDIDKEKLDKYAKNLYNEYIKYFNKNYKSHQGNMPYYPLESKELFDDFKRVIRLENVRKIDILKKLINDQPDDNMIQKLNSKKNQLENENLYMKAFNLLPNSNSGVPMGMQKIGVSKNFKVRQSNIELNEKELQKEAKKDKGALPSHIIYNEDGTIHKIVNNKDEEKTFKPTFFKKSKYKNEKYLKDENLYNQSKLFEDSELIHQISTPEGLAIVPISRLIREGKLDPNKPFNIYKLGIPSYGDKKASGKDVAFPLRINPDHMYMLRRRPRKK